jgi:DNA-binding transcriptional MerR regulator
MGAVVVGIGAVARELGVSPSTLRSWERRYKIVAPRRDEHGQRLYDAAQIALLRRVAAQIRRGVRARAAHDMAAAPMPLRISRAHFAPSPDAPQQARRAVDALLGSHEDRQLAFLLRLLASELVTNAILYGSEREPIQIDMQLFADAAELEVRNRGSRLRLKKLRANRHHGGRGLEIIDVLAESWSIETGPRGTRIAVRLALTG